MKLARVFVSLDPPKWFDFPIQEGNTFANLMLNSRMQGFLLDGTINVYIPFAEIKNAFEVQTDTTQGMTRQ